MEGEGAILVEAFSEKYKRCKGTKRERQEMQGYKEKDRRCKGTK